MGGHRIRIRAAAPEDIHAICGVLQRAFASLDGRGYAWRALRAAMIPPEEIKDRLARGAHVFVAEIKGTIAGTATGIEEDEILHVCSIAVDPAFQGRGIGRRLMRRLERLARERGCRKLYLQTAWAMIEAIQLYRSLGYEQEGSQRAHFYGEDFLMFAKMLDEADAGERSLYIRGLDVFSGAPFKGNPTAVVLNADGLKPRDMQTIARELNLETTFVKGEGGRLGMTCLRYFMPLREVELCGHGTIGAIWALAAEGMIPRGLSRHVVDTPVGPLGISLDWEDGQLMRVIMDQLPPTVEVPDCSAEEVACALRITRDEIDVTGLSLRVASTGRAKLLIPVRDLQVLDSLRPDMQALDRLCERVGATGFYPFTLEPRNPDATAEARQFPCGGGVLEDPVTGVAACALGAYLVHEKAVPAREPVTTVLIEQGFAIRRPGRVEVRLYLRGGRIAKTQIAGRAVLVSRSEMRFWARRSKDHAKQIAAGR